jgi:hypothetical protein
MIYIFMLLHRYCIITNQEISYKRLLTGSVQFRDDARNFIVVNSMMFDSASLNTPNVIM